MVWGGEVRAEGGVFLLEVYEDMGAGWTVVGGDATEGVEDYDTVEGDGLVDCCAGWGVGGKEGG